MSKRILRDDGAPTKVLLTPVIAVDANWELYVLVNGEWQYEPDAPFGDGQCLADWLDNTLGKFA